jgi:arginine-tRNA-protein transferase
MTKHDRDVPQFYMTAASPCPYVDGQMERKVFTHLAGPRAEQLNNMLTQWGFRRSQSIAYRPACENCARCISVRVLVDEFEPSRSFRRISRNNRDLTATMMAPSPSSEQYDLFRTYLDSRHADGGMADMTVLDYAMMTEDSSVDTRIVEYRQRKAGWLESEAAARGPLLGVALTDVLGDGLSMVYSFYDSNEVQRSLGTYMILEHIERTRKLGLPYLYLGYWIESSPKMAYKSRFQPQEHLLADGWVRT